MEKGVTMSPPPPPPPPGFIPPPPLSHSVPPPSYEQPQTNPVIIRTLNFGPAQQNIICPTCHTNVFTIIEREANMKTHLFALGLCLLGCWCCVPCPYCMDSCLVTKHYCPSCRTYLGQSDN
ncbi:lipopolysaccharide-induced tumor necrosis factor-alpha factor-like [Bombus pyrosoma]|uniref:lipopolysaccharide-induced tumor necrosis factor-alpha factor-like n=1 Tax=Bombus pyrosoma TaxID=396416 RepID=UPI001CB90AE6|nr:lipopolysaccharide-induced tumor necrosis factor-alpha factor-like [Bombus pyrosoma]